MYKINKQAITHYHRDRGARTNTQIHVHLCLTERSTHRLNEVLLSTALKANANTSHLFTSNKPHFDTFLPYLLLSGLLHLCNLLVFIAKIIKTVQRNISAWLLKQTHDDWLHNIHFSITVCVCVCGIASHHLQNVFFYLILMKLLTEIFTHRSI